MGRCFRSGPHSGWFHWRHHIEMGEHSPIQQPMRRTPFALRDKIDTMVKEMAEQGVIRLSRSPWSSPVVLVRKKDHTMRFCVDYRKLNSITKMDSFPLPRIDDTLDMLSQSKFFTVTTRILLELILTQNTHRTSSAMHARTQKWPLNTKQKPYKIHIMLLSQVSNVSRILHPLPP